MSGCIFCKIVKGEVPCAKVYEDEYIIAFLDIAPARKGHTLVVPKAHTENIFDTPVETLSKIFTAIKKIAPAVKQGAHADAVNISSNNGAAAGQAVMHYHWHIIPRNTEDGLKHWPQQAYREDMDVWRQRIAEQIGKQ